MERTSSPKSTPDTALLALSDAYTPIQLLTIINHLQSCNRKSRILICRKTSQLSSLRCVSSKPAPQLAPHVPYE